MPVDIHIINICVIKIYPSQNDLTLGLTNITASKCCSDALWFWNKFSWWPLRQKSRRVLSIILERVIFQDVNSIQLDKQKWPKKKDVKEVSLFLSSCLHTYFLSDNSVPVILSCVGKPSINMHLARSFAQLCSLLERQQWMARRHLQSSKQHSWSVVSLITDCSVAPNVPALPNSHYVFHNVSPHSHLIKMLVFLESPSSQHLVK